MYLGSITPYIQQTTQDEPVSAHVISTTLKGYRLPTSLRYQKKGIL